MKIKWKKIGEISVDSGQILVCDPCYLKDWKADRVSDEGVPSADFSYSGACSQTLSEKRCGGIGDGLGIAIATAYGDGTYPVYVLRDERGSPTQVLISFEDIFEEEE